MKQILHPNLFNLFYLLILVYLFIYLSLLIYFSWLICFYLTYIFIKKQSYYL